ncbi:glycosyltransferase family 92 protein [Candidatus Protochlamydia phocaeensis]|uniref:glycosyltransferase family 92 protein n=1 Tax=Candidatus Protochlamydia phocaeensis TaxID=1414722 RepID=UPI0008392A56|nr:glycosyltransferase family 92 protein [Candidatus Protochlamydia phocaeensis]
MLHRKLPQMIVCLCLVLHSFLNGQPFTFENIDEQDFDVPIEKPYDLVICALFQNEELFMKEWIEYHKLLGVQHFYLYNNLSTDHSLEILKPYIEAGEVDVFHWPIKTSNHSEMNALQIATYMDALQIAKKTARWAAFIDIDEFLVPMKTNSLIRFLQDYESYPGVIINWQMYGTSGYDDIPNGKLLIETLLFKAQTNSVEHQYFKSIVQPAFVSHVTEPHSFHFFPGFFAVNPERTPHTASGVGIHPSICIDRIRINHYCLGTKNWFIFNKLPRREKWGMPKLTPIQLENLFNQFNQVKDESILRFVPALRKKIFPFQTQTVESFLENKMNEERIGAA